MGSAVWSVLAVFVIVAGSMTLVIWKTEGGATEEVRSMGGVFAVVAADAAMAIAAVWAASAVGGNNKAAIISSAVTGITAVTSAYFGIKAASNTAKNVIEQHAGGARRGSGPQTGTASADTSARSVPRDEPSARSRRGRRKPKQTP